MNMSGSGRGGGRGGRGGDYYRNKYGGRGRGGGRGSGGGYYSHAVAMDMTVEAQWKQLPNYADTEANALVVCDVSGSMFQGNPSAISVATSLAIYIAERNKGAFKDHFITFSETPKLERLKGNSLYEKVKNLSSANWGISTNLQSVFDLVLRMAVKNRVPASEMPSSIFIVSDMEFDSCIEGRNFDAIQSKFAKAGYEMPKLVFWNVMSRNNQTPVTMDEEGTFLVSGCSPSIFSKAINTHASMKHIIHRGPHTIGGDYAAITTKSHGLC